MKTHFINKLYKICHTSMMADIFEDSFCLIGKEVLDNVFVRDFLKQKEIPFTDKGMRYSREHVWKFGGDVAKIKIGIKGKYGIVGAIVYINYSKLRYEPYVAIVDNSGLFESIDVVADMVARSLNWVYKGSGITLSLVPWIPAEGEVIQWGRDCNEAHNLAMVNGPVNIEEDWDLETSVKTIIKKHKNKKGVSPPKKENTKTSEKTIRSAIVDQTKADAFMQKINNCLIGKTEPMDEMMPFTAAYAAKVMRRPEWTELKNSYPELKLSETSFYRLRNPDCPTYKDDAVFEELVEWFKHR